MKSPADDLVAFRLSNKVYEIACPAERREAFNQSVGLLRTKVKQVQDSDPNAAADRVAVIAALNLGNDFLTLRQQCPERLEPRIQELNVTVEETLAQAREQNLL